MKLLTQSEYARQRGISKSYICELVKEGVIPTHKGKINPEEADKILGSISQRLSYSEAKTLVMNIKARLLQIEMDEKLGKLIEVEKVKNIFVKAGNTVRDAILVIPSKLAHRLAHEKDPEKCREILDKELRQALEELSKLGE